MPQSHALIVDDEPDIRELLEITLGRMDIKTCSAENVGSAKQLLKQSRFDLCLTDLQLPDGNGIDLVAYMQKQYPATPVAVITAFGSMDTAISALKAGAFDYVSKPVNLQQLRELVENALKLARQSLDAASDVSTLQILGKSETIVRLKNQISKLARSQAPVYISGESGTGKELVARQIHQSGPRRDAPFIPVNCGAIPGELMESEFFGHKKGSFTGAYADKEGLFQAAHGGTLFLDEVADLPLHMQVKLLRAIQEKSIRPVGAHKETPVDIRLLSATHKNLLQEVELGNFRQDLYYRINVIQLDVPPLRAREGDIVILSEHILERLAKDNGMPLPQLSQAALAALNQYAFPGNVRELENILERALTLCEENTILPHHLQLSTSSTPFATSPACTPPSTRQVADQLPEGMPLEAYLNDVEKNILLKSLEETRWNRTAAAKNLGMTFRSLRYRLKKLGIDEDKGDDRHIGEDEVG